MFSTVKVSANEELAKRAKENISFSDYRQGSATSRANAYVDSIVEYANKFLKKYPTEDEETLQKVQYYIDKYAEKIKNAIDKDNEITCRCPSVLITGAGNFPTRKKEKQNEASHSHWLKTKDLYETNDSNYYFKKIRLTLSDSGVIKSDDKNAVQKIKDKIAKLETLPDPYGNNKAEIRRLKGRLLALAPNEVKKGVEITINGLEATYENIIKIFDDGKFSLINGSYYLSIPLEFYNGKRKYKEYLSEKVNEDKTLLHTYGNKENNYETVWKPITDDVKFNLVIRKISGSGNKAVMYQILKDLDPKEIEKKEEIEKMKENGESTDKQASINGEDVTIKRNEEDVRLQIFFDGVPELETRTIMKSNGFKWSPKNKAWQRLLNSNSEVALKRILE